MATKRAVTRAVYGFKDVMTLLDCSRSYAYQIIKNLRKMQAEEGYVVVAKTGYIEQSYFNAKVYSTNESA